MFQRSPFPSQVLLWGDRLKRAGRIGLTCSSILVGSAIATAPVQAATFSLAYAEFEFANFSHRPASVFTDTKTSTFTLSLDGSVTATADADALFINAPFIPAEAFNFTLSQAVGFGNNYLGQAESSATVAGYRFEIAPQETFFFDFWSLVTLFTSVSNPEKESAQATGNIFFQVFDTTDRENGILLDSFNLLARLKAPSGTNLLAVDRSSHVSFELDSDSIDSSSDSEALLALLGQGRFERTFERLTYLTLLEVKSSEVKIVQTPEPSSLLTFLLLGLIGMWRHKRSHLND